MLNNITNLLIPIVKLLPGLAIIITDAIIVASLFCEAYQRLVVSLIAHQQERNTRTRQ
jgi:hypothetical protein